jgi:hypothetical protein
MTDPCPPQTHLLPNHGPRYSDSRSIDQCPSRSDPGRLHVAAAAADILRRTGMFNLTDRGEMPVKGNAGPPLLSLYLSPLN